MSAHDALVLRSATNADGPQIWQLISGVLRDYGIATDLASTDQDLRDIEASYSNAGGAFFVLMDELVVVGTVALARDTDTVCELCRMYLASHCRRRGLGRVLLRKALDEAQQRGFSEVRLETARVLTEAIALYQSVGFAVVDGTPSGKNCNLLMSKALK